MGKSNQFKILRDNDGSEWTFVSSRFSDALIARRDMVNKPVKEQGDKTKPLLSLSKMYSEIYELYHITESALKNWKAGYNGPSSIDDVKNVSVYLGIDYHDLLEPVKKEIRTAMSEEKRFISWIFEQCVDLVWLKISCVPDSDNIGAYIENKFSVIKKKAESLHLEIERKVLLFSSEFCNKLHRIVFEVTDDNAFVYDPPYRESISKEMAFGIENDYEYLNYSDRAEYIRDMQPGRFSRVDTYVAYDEVSWLEEMGIYDYKTIDADFDSAYNELDEREMPEDEKEILTDQIISYGAGSVEGMSTMNPREIALHHYCKDLQLVFKHDFPEIDW